jgi:hypothetical protein
MFCGCGEQVSLRYKNFESFVKNRGYKKYRKFVYGHDKRPSNWNLKLSIDERQAIMGTLLGDSVLSFQPIEVLIHDYHGIMDLYKRLGRNINSIFSTGSNRINIYAKTWDMGIQQSQVLRHAYHVLQVYMILYTK